MSGLTRVAQTSCTFDAAILISSLEAAGFDVHAPWFHFNALYPHWAMATGGIPICVPTDQAQDAYDLLNTTPMPRPQDRPQISVLQLLWRLTLGYWFFIHETAPISTGSYTIKVN